MTFGVPRYSLHDAPYPTPTVSSPSSCFQITDTIEHRLNGSVINMVKPLGAVVIALLVIGSVLLWIFMKWGSLMMALKMDNQKNKKELEATVDAEIAEENEKLSKFDEADEAASEVASEKADARVVAGSRVNAGIIRSIV